MTPPKPIRPPSPPRNADPSVLYAGDRQSQGYDTMIQTSSTGLKRPATTGKRTLIGGAS